MVSFPNVIEELGGEGAPVVLVGEILSGHRSWSYHAAKLAENWRVIGATPLVTLLASRGQPCPEDWCISMETHALINSLDQAGLGIVHLVGWSLGGSIALEMAMLDPQRVRTLTLIEPQARWVLRNVDEYVEMEKSDSERFRIFEDRDIDERLLEAFFEMVGVVGPREVPHESKAWSLAWSNRLALRCVWRVVQHEGSLSCLDQLRMPILLVRGKDSLQIDRAVIGVLADRLVQSKMLDLSGNHSSHITDSELFLGALGETLGR